MKTKTTIDNFFSRTTDPHWKNKPRRLGGNTPHVARANKRHACVNLGAKMYRTAREAKDACRLCIKHTPVKGVLQPKCFFDDIARHHRKGIDKVNVEMVVEWRKANHNFGIEFIEQDGTVDSISWNQCIERAFCPGAADKSQWACRILKCFRNEVQCQVDAFRGRFVEGCHDTPMHVDHDYENGLRFVELVKRFMGCDDYANSIHPHQVGEGEEFVDREFAGRWQRYHLDHAKLRMIPKMDNLKGNLAFKRGCPYGRRGRGWGPQ